MNYIEALKNLVEENPTRVWTSREIFEELVKRGIEQRGVDRATMPNALRKMGLVMIGSRGGAKWVMGSHRHLIEPHLIDTRKPLPDDVKEVIYACFELIGYVSVCQSMKAERQSGGFPKILENANMKAQKLSEKYRL